MQINNEEFSFGPKMRVLGVRFDHKMKFSEHVSDVVKKARN